MTDPHSAQGISQGPSPFPTAAVTAAVMSGETHLYLLVSILSINYTANTKLVAPEPYLVENQSAGYISSGKVTLPHLPF